MSNLNKLIMEGKRNQQTVERLKRGSAGAYAASARRAAAGGYRVEWGVATLEAVYGHFRGRVPIWAAT